MRDPIAPKGIGDPHALSPRIDTLDGATIGLFKNIKQAADPVARVVEEKLADRYDDIAFRHNQQPARHENVLARIGEWAAAETDACIVAIGDCGGCTRAVVRATNAIEAAGTPAVGLVADGFELSWKTNAADQGRHLRYQKLPIQSETTDTDELRERITTTELDGIEAALTRALTPLEQGTEHEQTDLLA